MIVILISLKLKMFFLRLGACLCLIRRSIKAGIEGKIGLHMNVHIFKYLMLQKHYVPIKLMLSLTPSIGIGGALLISLCTI